MDGSVATDFFTVLSTGQRFTEDQRLNVQAFSMLRAWLLQGGPERLGATDADDRSELEGSTVSVLSAASTASHLLPPAEWLREKALEYCQRLLEQSGRRESCACPTCPASCPAGVPPGVGSLAAL